jgi:hypothetical protein
MQVAEKTEFNVKNAQKTTISYLIPVEFCLRQMQCNRQCTKKAK